jgi:hypothetical protein
MQRPGTLPGLFLCQATTLLRSTVSPRDDMIRRSAANAFRAAMPGLFCERNPAIWNPELSPFAARYRRDPFGGIVMTYDPYRNDPRPNDPYPNPYRVTDPDREVGAGPAVLLGALLLAAIGGFIFFYGAGDSTTMLSSDLRPQLRQPQLPAVNPPETTGAGQSGRQ